MWINRMASLHLFVASKSSLATVTRSIQVVSLEGRSKPFNFHSFATTTRMPNKLHAILIVNDPHWPHCYWVWQRHCKAAVCRSPLEIRFQISSSKTVTANHIISPTLTKQFVVVHIVSSNKGWWIKTFIVFALFVKDQVGGWAIHRESARQKRGNGSCIVLEIDPVSLILICT